MTFFSFILGDNARHPVANQRNDSRKESIAHSISTSDNATPQSVAVDTDITTPTRLHSGEPTPTAALDNIGTTVSGPRSVGLTPQTAEQGLALITKSLLTFAQTTTKQSLFALQKDNIAKRFEQKKREHERWYSQHNSFTSLAEEQIKDMNKTKEDLAQATEICEKFKETQDKSLESLAQTLFSLSTGSALPQLDNTRESIQIKADIQKIQSDLDDAKFASNSINQSVKDLVAQHDHLSTQVKAMETHSISRKIYSDLESEVTKLASKTDQVRDDLGVRTTEIGAQIVKLEEQNSSLNRSTLESDHGKLSALSQEFQAIKLVVHGAGKEEPPLLDIIQGHDDDIAKLKSAFEVLNDNLDTLHDARQGLDARIATIESNSIATNQDIVSSLDVKTTLRNLSENVSDVSLELASLREEQIAKDAAVEAEIDQLKNEVQQVQAAIESDAKRRLALEAQVEVSNSRIQSLLSRKSATITQDHAKPQMTPSPKPNMQSFTNLPSSNHQNTGALPTGLEQRRPSPLNNIQGLSHSPSPHPSPAQNMPPHGYYGPQLIQLPIQSPTNGANYVPSSVLPSSVQQMQPPPTASRRSSGTVESQWSAPAPVPMNCIQALTDHAHRILRCEHSFQKIQKWVDDCQSAVQRLYHEDFTRHMVTMVHQSSPKLSNLANIQTDVESLKIGVASLTKEMLELRPNGQTQNNVIDLTSGVSEEHFEKAVNGLKADIEKVSQGLREICTIVKGPTSKITKLDWTKLTTTFVNVKKEMEKELESLRSDFDAMQEGQRLVNEENVAKFEKLHGSIQNLESHVGIPGFKPTDISGQSPTRAAMRSLPVAHSINSKTPRTTAEAKTEPCFRRKKVVSEDIEQEGN